ncbi:hypothetical protein OHT77_01080 [Streptomyces sp. NBC_00252]|uniref:hypothetical protein n=1 Tax=Streptomyces sp. NBC_00252 TaxID=2975691 RepID=UPI002E29D106|nr:hypothetical protein [Streptomyces sp. NBC_00252]
MRRLQNARSVLREADVSETEQEAAKAAAMEARTLAGEALTELQLLSEVWRAQQAAMHTALRTILTAQGYWMSDDRGDTPVVFGPHPLSL